MTVRLKIIVATLAALFVLLLMILWSAFVFLGRTPIDPFINQIGALITIAVGLVSAFFGHQAASGTSAPVAAQLVAGEAFQPLTAPPRAAVDAPAVFAADALQPAAQGPVIPQPQ